MQTIKIWLALLLTVALFNVNAQNYDIEITDEAPCNLVMYYNSSPIIHDNFLIEELTWIEQTPNGVVMRDNERTVTMRANQIGNLEDERRGISNPPPNTVAEFIDFVEGAKGLCLTRIVGDTLFIGNDTLIGSGGVSENIYTIDGTQTGGPNATRTYTFGGGLQKLYFNDPVGTSTVSFGAPTQLGNFRVDAAIQRFYNGTASLELVNDKVGIGTSFGQTSDFEVFLNPVAPSLFKSTAQAYEINVRDDFGAGLFDLSLEPGSLMKISDGIVGYGVPGAVLTSNGTYTTWQLPPGSNNFYNINGVLTNPRTVDGAGNSLTYNSLDAFTVAGAAGDISFIGATNFNVITPNIGLGVAGATLFSQLNGGIVQIGNDDAVGSDIRIKTPNVETGTAQVNDVLTLVNTNGEVEFQTANPKIWQVQPLSNPKTVEILAFADTSIQIQDSLLILNGANIEDNKGNEIPKRSEFGSLISTYKMQKDDLSWSPQTDPIDVWANVNPLEKVYRWSGFYGNRETNYSLPGGVVGEQSYSAVLNSDGNIWNIGFDWGGGYIINPNSGTIERITEGVGFAGQAMVNPIDGLTYITAISFNSIVQNPQLREVALPGYPAFDVSLGFTRFNTGMGGAIASINNTLYSPPYTESQTTQVARYDLTNNTGAFLPGNIATTGAGDFAYTSCSEAIDGKVYCFPYNNDYLLEIDPLTNTWIQWGNGNANPIVSATNGGWALINHPNGKMYAPPFVGAQTLEIDPVLKTITPIGTIFPTGAGNNEKWGSAALHPNGKIYCFPHNDQTGNVLEIDPATGTTTILPIVSTSAYWSTKVALNGSIWGLPRFGNGNVTRLDINLGDWIYPIELVTSPQFSSR